MDYAKTAWLRVSVVAPEKVVGAIAWPLFFGLTALEGACEVGFDDVYVGLKALADRFSCLAGTNGAALVLAVKVCCGVAKAARL